MNPVLAALRDAPHCSVSSIKSYLMCPMNYAEPDVMCSWTRTASW
jgi:hypothetical protein